MNALLIKNLSAVQGHMKGGKSPEDAVRAAYPDFSDADVNTYIKENDLGSATQKAITGLFSDMF